MYILIFRNIKKLEFDLNNNLWLRTGSLFEIINWFDLNIKQRGNNVIYLDIKYLQLTRNFRKLLLQRE